MPSFDSSAWGKNLSLSIYGGSHDPEIGMRLTGFPAGIMIDKDDMQAFMSRRAPGQSKLTTSRKEPDVPVFLSGLGEDCATTGETLHAAIYNTNQRSGDYAAFANVPRPSHADYCARMKYGDGVDLRGGGHWSARLTAPLCIAGYLCRTWLWQRGIRIGAHIAAIAGIPDTAYDPVRLDEETLLSPGRKTFPVLDDGAGEAMMAAIDEARMQLDSVGGIVECAVTGLPVGLGEHMFDGAEGRIASLLYSIPAVKGVEFGDGFGVAVNRGSVNNDPFVTDGVTVKTKTNHCGGILGGMTNGMPLTFRCAFKPTPSIGLEQDSVDLTAMQNVKLTIGGRHDPCVVQRAVPVVEAAAAIAVMDMMLDCEER
ncbi:MAG: chorismate synthase [Clostridia bacterium]|nr:chorismate synthase [Clostridia bacterium]